MNNKTNIRKEKSKAAGVAYFGVAAAFNDKHGDHVVIYQTERQLKERYPNINTSRLYKVALFKSEDVEAKND